MMRFIWSLQRLGNDALRRRDRKPCVLDAIVFNAIKDVNHAPLSGRLL